MSIIIYTENDLLKGSSKPYTQACLKSKSQIESAEMAFLFVEGEISILKSRSGVAEAKRFINALTTASAPDLHDFTVIRWAPESDTVHFQHINTETPDDATHIEFQSDEPTHMVAVIKGRHQSAI